MVEQIHKYADRTARVAVAIISSIALIPEPTTSSIISTLATNWLLLREDFKQNKKTKELYERTLKRLSSQLDEPTVHLPSDGKELLLQMLESSFLNGFDPIESDLNVEGILTNFCDTFTEPEHKRYELQSAFKELLGPILIDLFADPAFQEENDTPIKAVLLGRQTDILAGQRHLEELLTADKRQAVNCAVENAKKEELLPLASSLGLNPSPDDSLENLRHDVSVAVAQRNEFTKGIEPTGFSHEESMEFETQIFEASKRGDAASVGLLLSDQRQSLEKALEQSQLNEAASAQQLKDHVSHTKEVTRGLVRNLQVQADNQLLVGNCTGAYDALTRAAELASSIGSEEAEEAFGYGGLKLRMHGHRAGSEGHQLCLRLISAALKHFQSGEYPKLYAKFLMRRGLVRAELGKASMPSDYDAFFSAALADIDEALSILQNQFPNNENGIRFAKLNQALALRIWSERLPTARAEKLLRRAVRLYEEQLPDDLRADAVGNKDYETALQDIINYTTALWKLATLEPANFDVSLLNKAEATASKNLEVLSFERFTGKASGLLTSRAMARKSLGQNDSSAAGISLLEAAVNDYKTGQVLLDAEQDTFGKAISEQNLALALEAKAEHQLSTNRFELFQEALERLNMARKFFHPRRHAYHISECLKQIDRVNEKIGSLAD